MSDARRYFYKVEGEHKYYPLGATSGPDVFCKLCGMKIVLRENGRWFGEDGFDDCPNDPVGRRVHEPRRDRANTASSDARRNEMAKIQMSKEDALAILDGDKTVGVIVSDDVTGNGRWSIYHSVIFQVKGKFLRGNYSVGATEKQDESPWEYSDNVEFEEVEPYEKTVTAYRPISIG